MKMQLKNLSFKMKVEKGEYNPPFEFEFSLEEIACELEGETIGNLIHALVGGGDSHESHKS